MFTKFFSWNVLVALSLGLLCVQARAQNYFAYSPNFPSSPLAPSFADCVDLQRKYLVVGRQLISSWDQCISEAPTLIEIHTDCNGLERTIAWPQCKSRADALCQFEKTQKREVATCEARARQASLQSGSQGDAPNAHSRATLESLDKVKAAKEKLEHAISIGQKIADPQRYLPELLDTHSAVKELVRGDKRVAIKDPFLKSVYIHLQSLAGRATSTGQRDELIKAIQSAALDELDGRHLSTLNLLTELQSALTQEYPDEVQFNPFVVTPTKPIEKPKTDQPANVKVQRPSRGPRVGSW